MDATVLYNSVLVKGLKINDLVLDTIGNLSTSTLNSAINGSLELSGFLGDASFEQDTLTLDGKANKILVTGENKFSLIS